MAKPLTFTISNVDAIGYTPDLYAPIAPQDGDQFSWTIAQNVRVRDGAMEKVTGLASATKLPAAPDALYGIIPVISSSYNQYYWIGLATKNPTNFIYLGDPFGPTWASLTPTGTFGISGVPLWQWTTINNVIIVNAIGSNGVGMSIPIQIVPTNGSPTSAALSTWPTNQRCRSIREYKNYLVAVNMVNDSTGVNHTSRVKWSALADQGTYTVPPTWDITDATHDAGNIDIGDSTPFIDSYTLRDTHFLYKQNEAWAMTWVGGAQVFSFRKAFTSFGLYQSNCIAELNGQHILFGADDIILHDGVNAKSLVTRRIRRWLYSQLSTSTAAQAFVYRKQDEIWFVFATGSATKPTLALVWNWQTDSFSEREFLGGVYMMGRDVDVGRMTALDQGYVLVDGTSAVKVPDKANTWTDGGSVYTAKLGREKVHFGNDRMVKNISGIFPRITTPSGVATIDFYISGTMSEDAPEAYQGPFTITAGDGTNFKLNIPMISGRYFSFYFQSADLSGWRFLGMDFEYSEQGYW